MSMNPDAVSEIDLHAYVDDQLDPARRIEVEDYLAKHPGAAAAVMADLRARDALRLLAQTAATASPQTVGAARKLGYALARRRIVRGLPRAAAIALVGAIGWVAGDEWDEFPGASHAEAATPIFVEEAIMSHRTALVRARMPSQPEVPHFDEQDIREATQIVLPRLPKAWRVLDVQVFPSDQGPSLQVAVDKGDGKPLSLFAVRAETTAPSRPDVVRSNGEMVAFWRKGQLAYALTGAVSPADLDRLAEILAAELPGGCATDQKFMCASE